MNLHNYDVSIYVGQMIDGPQNGTAPGPWDIAASPPSLFQDYVQHFEVPHTASVKVKKKPALLKVIPLYLVYIYIEPLTCTSTVVEVVIAHVSYHMHILILYFKERGIYRGMF